MLEDIIAEYQANPENNDSAQLLSGAINYYLQNLAPKFSSLSRPALASLLTRVEQEKTRATNLSLFSKAALGLSIVVGIVVVVQVGAALVFSRRIISAMQAIVDAANAISRGDMDVPIDVEQGGEVGDLARAIDRMRISLRAAIQRLRR
jgi:HAMP domain-containing protein